MPNRNIQDVDVGEYVEAGSPSTAQVAKAITIIPDEPTLKAAVVMDVIYDPAALSPEKRSELSKNLKNPSLLGCAPRNAIIVKEVSGAADSFIGKSTLCFPLFPPHLSLPINTGESVFVMEIETKGSGPLPFWVCRIPNVNFVDDINFTHNDRSLRETSSSLPPPPPDSDPPSNPTSPGFPNGPADIEGTYTLSDPEAFEKIYASGSADKIPTTPEVVPRFTKRPGDFVLQGYNNTLISLGQDRGFTKADSEGTTPALSTDWSTPTPQLSNANVLDKKKVGRGTIDIVTGRGISPPTEPDKIKNTRGDEEVNKNPMNYGNTGEKSSPTPGNVYRKPNEGDPDFAADKSRVYISSNTSGDKNFGLDAIYPDYGGGDAGEKAYAIAKSDEVRLVGRDSVRLVSEKGSVTIEILGDNKIALKAGQIIIGDGTSGTQDGFQTFIGDGATERAVLGDTLRDQVLVPLKDKLMALMLVMKTSAPIETQLFGVIPVSLNPAILTAVEDLFNTLLQTITPNIHPPDPPILSKNTKTK
jgi:hypothetical protein